MEKKTLEGKYLVGDNYNVPLRVLSDKNGNLTAFRTDKFGNEILAPDWIYLKVAMPGESKRVSNEEFDKAIKEFIK